MAGTIEAAPVAEKPIRAPRAVKPRRAPKLSEKFFVVPGEVAWEVWAGSDAASAHLVETIENPADAGKHSPAAIAMPAREVVTQPLWLATTDRSLIPEMVALQCEKRGILNRTRVESVVDFEIAAQQDGESLVLAQLLSPSLSPEVCNVQIDRFNLSCRFFPLPDHALVVTRELGQLTVTLTRQKIPVYFATVGEAQINQSAISFLYRLLSVAQTERWIAAAPEVVLRGNFPATDETALRSALGLRVRREERPAPWPPHGESKLVPYPVRVASEGRRKGALLRQRILMAVGIYVGAILVWSGYVGWLAFQAHLLETRVKASAPEVASLRAAALRWTDLQPAINPAYYPMEVLYRCVNALPKEGVRLTLFEQRTGKLILIGEAGSLRAANKFADDLKASPDLADFTWNMPSPKVSDTACKFQIEGTRAPAHP